MGVDYSHRRSDLGEVRCVLGNEVNTVNFYLLVACLRCVLAVEVDDSQERT